MFEFVNDNTLAEYEAFNMSHPLPFRAVQEVGEPEG